MNDMELSLVLFTVLSQVSVGLAVMAALRQWAASEGPAPPAVRVEWILVGIVLLIGMVVSLFHLGHPEGSPRSILHLSNSWLSREILAFLIYGILVILGLVALWKETGGRGAIIKCAALVGLIALAVSGMVYSPPSFPALNNGTPVLFYLLTAFILGSAFSSYLAGPAWQPWLTRILLTSLVVGLVLNLLLPSIWLAGGRVMHQTGLAYYASALYWVRILGEFVLGIVVVAATRRIPIWLPVILLAGEILGRVIFFTNVVHTATNIGRLY